MKFGEIFDCIEGINLNKYQLVSKESGVGVLSIKNIDFNTNNINLNKCVYINMQNDNQFLKKNDILINVNNIHLVNVFQIKDDLNYFVDNSFIILRTKNVNSSFLFHYLSSQNFVDQLKTQLSILNSKKITINALNNINIELPCQGIQNKITNILDAINELKFSVANELDARKSQYQHYSKILLSLDSLNGSIWEQSNPHTHTHTEREKWRRNRLGVFPCSITKSDTRKNCSEIFNFNKEIFLLIKNFNQLIVNEINIRNNQYKCYSNLLFNF